jgi:hypothetical protein
VWRPPASRLELGLSLNYVNGEASMGSFDLSRPDFGAHFPNSSYDCSRTPEWSKLDLEGIDAGVDAKFRFTTNLFAREAYRYDLTGRNSPRRSLPGGAVVDF